MPPKAAPTPPGFTLLGMLLVTLATGCAINVAGAPSGYVSAALGGVIAMLSLVLVEALWWVRPWVARAADAWMTACVGAALLPGLGGLVVGARGFSEVLVSWLGLSLVVGLPCAGVRAYVWNRA